MIDFVTGANAQKLQTSVEFQEVVHSAVARMTRSVIGTAIAEPPTEVIRMSLVRLLGFTTLTCGCVSGRYREVATNREVTYIEEKGGQCAQPGHQRNQPVSADRVAHGFSSVSAMRAS